MALRYYLLINGMNGGVSAGSGSPINGAFEVKSFALDIEALTSYLKGTGASVGKPQLSPLELVMALDPGLGQLLSKIVAGTSISSVQLIGVRDDGHGAQQTMYDLRLKDVFVTKINDGNGGDDQLSLAYEQISLSTWTVKPDGTRGNEAKVAWDLAAGTANVPTIAVPVVAPATRGSASESVEYYLFIEGLNGGVTLKGYEGAFKVTDHMFDVAAETAYLSGTGLAVGKPAPGPLSLSLEDMGGGLTSLISTITKGLPYTKVRLVGLVSTGDPQPGVVYDLRLKDAFVTEVQDQAEGDRLSFVFKEVSLTTAPQLVTGKPGTATTVHWNVSSMTQDTAQLPAAKPSSSGSSPPNPTNAPPVGTATAVLPDGAEDTAYIISKTALLTGFSDADGDTLSVANLSANNGTLVDNGNGTWTLTPTENFHGQVALNYDVVDGKGGSADATLNLSLQAVNDAPTGSANAALADGQANSPYIVTNAMLLAGFSDVDGDALSVLGLSADQGSVVNNGNGTWTITPASGYAGTVQLSYTVSDGHGASIPGQQSFELIAELNLAPVGAPTAVLAVGAEDSDYAIAVADLLAGFSDPNGDSLSVTNLTANHGKLVEQADGSWVFVPDANYHGPVTLNYQVSDGKGGLTSASQAFALAAVNDAPVGSPTIQQLNGEEDQPYIVSAATLLAGFTDADGDALSVLNLSCDHGSVVNNGDGTWTINPAANFNGLTTLSYQVSDGHGGVRPASIGLNLADVDDPAILGSANVSVAETNAPLTVTGVLSISDIDTPPTFLAQPGTAGKYGSFSIGADGVWSYKANLAYDYLNPGESLKDVFTVKSSDGGTTTVAVTINGTAEIGTVKLGDAPVRQTGTGGQWAAAWTQSGYSIVHKADHTNAGEAWSNVTFSSVSSQNLSGGDIYSGDLGVSGQSAATSTTRAEIDGKEALRVNLPTLAHAVTLNLSNLFTQDEGSIYSESGLLRLLDSAGHVVGEQFFVANAADGTLSVTLNSELGFSAIELLAGAYDQNGVFQYGAYSKANGTYGKPVTADAAAKLHGSDFLVHSVVFDVELVGVPPAV